MIRGRWRLANADQTGIKFKIKFVMGVDPPVIFVSKARAMGLRPGHCVHPLKITTAICLV